mgnify:CR=1 FL=1
MKLLVREKVRDILTLAMLKDKGNYNILVSYMFKNLRVTVHYRNSLVFDKKIDLLDNNVEEELEEIIFQLKSLGEMGNNEKYKSNSINKQ